MPKYNFTKVEEALEEGLRKMQMEDLLELADIAGGGTADTKKERLELTIAFLGHVIGWLHKKDKEIYHKLGLKKKEIEEMLNEGDEAKIDELKAKVMEVREAIEGETTDEDIIEKQRQLHVKKRLNVNEKWMPMDVPDTTPFRPDPSSFE